VPPREARLAAILDSLAAGVVAVDAKGKVELCSAEACRMLGVSSKQVQGKRLAECLGGGHPAARVLQQVLESQRAVAVHEERLPGALGRPDQLVDLVAAPIGEGGSFQGAVLTLRDRTFGRELEELESQRQSAALYAELAAGIAHEIRNPLAGIRGAAELLEGRLPDAALRRYPELIRHEVDRVRGLLDDLAQLTRGGELCARQTNLHRVLDETLELHTRAPESSRIELVREYDPSIPELEFDPDRMKQVFLNLAHNAAQAMQGAGRLLVRTRYDAMHQLARDQGPGRHVVRIDFEDTGPGFDEADLPNVFTPFFTRKPSGHGLGLAIAQHWVVRHGGRIEISRAESGGARVRVLLPIGMRA
jgi:two-component system nitrogen regulation sensor histidine kinase GlnL